jgi:hypothetical protein
MTPPAWLLLVINLPGRRQTLRMRVWRALKTGGAGPLRDGVYVLPNSTASRQLFEEQAREIQTGGGTSQILPFDSDAEPQQAAMRALFDRSRDYASWRAQLDLFKREVGKLGEVEARRRLAVLRRESAALAAIDFFPGEAHAQMELALTDAEAALNARYSPDEPQAIRRKIAHLERGDYQGRVWATREHLWVDRVCSAWLIRRFIDPKAKFVWLKRAKDCPKRAIGFDFDGAPFTHVGTQVTFEVLLTSFGLEHDPALAQLGALVHYLDTGGIPVAEAAGLSAVLAGARVQEQNDDTVLKVMTWFLDCLYSTYAGSPKHKRPESGVRARHGKVKGT